MALKRDRALVVAKRIAAAAFLALAVWAFFGGHRLAHLAVSLQAVPASLRNPWVAIPSFFVLTLLFGRVFCEAMCPLGIMQSLVNFIFHPKTQVRRVCTRLPESKAQLAVRWSVFALVMALWGFGFGAIAYSFEPYTILGRTLTLCGYFPALMAAILIAAAVGKGRLWCNWICPFGTLFALVGRYAPWGNKVEKRCANCRKCFPGAKPSAEKTPEGGVTRREALKGVAVLAVAEKLTDGGLADLIAPGKSERKSSVLPPGAVSRGRFERRCLGCGLCVTACPTGVLAPSMSLRTYGQPELDFSRGFCSVDCDGQCSKVCPAGALLPLGGAARRDVHIGVAVWHADRCLRAKDGVNCNLCERKCPVNAIHIAGGVPVVDELACIGCGVCERQCAARPLPALTVEGLDIHRVVRPMDEAELFSEMARLVDGGAAVVVAKDGVIRGREEGRGIAPLMKLHDARALRGAMVFDKVIGRAAAAICISGGVKKVRAKLMSKGAKQMLEASGVPAEGETVVDMIENREKTGMCPMEKTVEKLSDPAEMVEALRRKMK